jgi:hypothetical protein
MEAIGLLPAGVWAGVLAGVAGLLGWLWRETRTLLSHLPPGVAALLKDREARAELLAIVVRVAGYANLSMEERRRQAIEFAAQWLENHGIHLSDHELSLLVELLYAVVHREQPQAIAPEPFPLGRREERA